MFKRSAFRATTFRNVQCFDRFKTDFKFRLVLSPYSRCYLREIVVKYLFRGLFYNRLSSASQLDLKRCSRSLKERVSTKTRQNGDQCLTYLLAARYPGKICHAVISCKKGKGKKDF